MVGCAIRNGTASSVTEQTPVRSRSSMARRVGSARAPKMALSRSGAAGLRRLAYIAMLLYTRSGRFYQGATELPAAVGARGDGTTVFGRMILEARIHFIAVIEECRIAGLDTSVIALILGKENRELVDSIRPEMWNQVEQVIAQRVRKAG